MRNFLLNVTYGSMKNVTGTLLMIIGVTVPGAQTLAKKNPIQISLADVDVRGGLFPMTKLGNKPLEIFMAYPKKGKLATIFALNYGAPYKEFEKHAATFVSSSNIALVVINPPGWGKSGGTGMGPETLDVIAEAVGQLQNLSFVDPSKMFVYSGIWGSTLTGMLQAKKNLFAGIILVDPVFDSVAFAKVARMPEKAKADYMTWAKANNLSRHLHEIKKPVLVLFHKEFGLKNLATLYLDQMRRNGTNVDVKLLENKQAILERLTADARDFVNSVGNKK